MAFCFATAFSNLVRKSRIDVLELRYVLNDSRALHFSVSSYFLYSRFKHSVIILTPSVPAITDVSSSKIASLALA